MWKSIEIKPNDSSLVGRKIKTPSGTLELTVLFVGKARIFVSYQKSLEGYDECASWLDGQGWQIWEEPKRWRCKHNNNDSYYFSDSAGHVYGSRDIGCMGGDLHFKSGNYWRTKDQAQTYADECKKLAMKLHESFGE